MFDEPVLISSLAHYGYCPRRCGLIHVERVWEENLFTLKGKDVHERTDAPTSRAEDGLRVERGLPIWSDGYGLVGQADTVEFTPQGQPYPVEYKSGARKHRDFAWAQLCAQGLCLEDMFGCVVPEGAIFWIASRKREVVSFDAALRDMTLRMIEEIRTMILSGKLPSAVDDSRCPKCSLVDACLPGVVRRAALVQEKSLFLPRPEVDFP